MRGIFPSVWLSPRGVWVLLGLSALVAGASIISWLLWVVYFSIILFTAALIVDFRYAPTKTVLRVARHPVGRLLLGRFAVISYAIENMHSSNMRIAIVESPSTMITFEHDTLMATLPAHACACVEQRVIARQRGKVRFGALYLWVENGIGMLRWRYMVAADEEVDVFPDLSVVERHGALASRKTLLEMGLRALRLRGVGSEFESLREYGPGDDFRRINWKATARRGHLITQRYEVERNTQVIVLLDCGRLMTPRMQGNRKFDYVLAAGLSVVRIAQAADDCVGLSAFAARPLLSIAPRRGKAHVASLMRAVFDLQPRFEESDYELAFADIENRYTKRGLIVFFTDVFDPVTSMNTLNGLRRLAKKHLVLCVLMNDASISQALSEEPKTSAQAYRFGVALALSEERARVVAQLRSIGIMVLDVPASRLTPALLEAYLDLKARARI